MTIRLFTGGWFVIGKIPTELRKKHADFADSGKIFSCLIRVKGL